MFDYKQLDSWLKKMAKWLTVKMGLLILLSVSSPRIFLNRYRAG